MGPDYRQQQELDEELQHSLFDALDRTAEGSSTVDDARLLAWASGVMWEPTGGRQ